MSIKTDFINNGQGFVAIVKNVDGNKYLLTADKDAAEQIVIGNDALVYYIAYQLFPTYLNSDKFEDLIQEGRIGLLKALDTYNPEKGMFSTHASFLIKNHMYRLTSNESNHSSYYQTQIKQYKKAVAGLSAEGVTAPTIADIADKMSEQRGKVVGIGAVQKIMAAMNRTNHISIEGDEDVKAFTSDSAKSPLETAIANEEREALKDALRTLDKKQRFVIEKTFLMTDEKQETLVNIGKELGDCKPEDVKRIRQSALRQLNRVLTDKGFGRDAANKYDDVASGIKVIFHSQTTTVVDEIKIIEM